MGKYQFVVGVSLAALEEEVNRLVQDDPSLSCGRARSCNLAGVTPALEGWPATG